MIWLCIALLILSVACAVCILANELWKGFEEYAAAKLAEDAWQDVAHGDCPRVSDFFHETGDRR